jgi:hypothetical protein
MMPEKSDNNELYQKMVQAQKLIFSKTIRPSRWFWSDGRFFEWNSKEKRYDSWEYGFDEEGVLCVKLDTKIEHR